MLSGKMVVMTIERERVGIKAMMKWKGTQTKRPRVTPTSSCCCPRTEVKKPDLEAE